MSHEASNMERAVKMNEFRKYRKCVSQSNRSNVHGKLKSSALHSLCHNHLAHSVLDVNRHPLEAPQRYNIHTNNNNNINNNANNNNNNGA